MAEETILTNFRIRKTNNQKFEQEAVADDKNLYLVKILTAGASLLYIGEDGQVKATQDLSFIRGYDPTKTQTLKQSMGVLQWVND